MSCPIGIKPGERLDVRIILLKLEGRNASMTTANAYEVRIDFDQRVPMRDGITLSADIYRLM